MLIHSRTLRGLSPALATALVAFALLAPLTPRSKAAVPIANPCGLPGPDLVCDAAGDVVGSVAQAAGDSIMRGVTSWVTNAAVWVTGKVGGLIDATTSPNVESPWFQRQYSSMLKVAGALALPMLLLAVIEAVWRQDVWILLRSAFGYLPMAFILAGAAIVATQLLVWIADDLSRIVVTGLGQSSSNLMRSIGDAYKHALDDSSSDAIPLFGIFLGAVTLAIGAFVLWLEMIARDAAIYIALFFLPLTFVAMIWPATSRWARRLVELLVAVVFAKFVILSIISLATGAITSTALAEAGESNVFERMVAGSALLVLAAWSPFALLRLIPMMEVAAASVTSQRAAMTSAAGSAGIQSPAAYVRQAMDSHARASASPRSSGAPLTLYAGGATGGGPGGGAGASGARPAERETGAADVRAEAASGGSPRATYPPASRGGRPTGSGESDVETGKERVGEERPADSPSSPPSESGSRRGPPPDRPASPQPPREEE